MAYRIVKWGMAAAAALYLALVLLLPAAAGLRRDWFAWSLYGAYVLITAMVWAIDSKATRTVGQGIDKDAVNKETKVTQEAEMSKWRWSSM